MAKLVRTCSIWRALDVLGDSSNLLISQAAMLGARSFGDFEEATGLRRSLLSDRFKKLINFGYFEKKLYSESPVRYKYLMTEMGLSTYWISLMLLRWERKWGDSAERLNLRLTHTGCGEVFEPIPYCLTCKHEYNAFEVDWVEGPGVGMIAATYIKRRQRRGAIEDRPLQTALMIDAANILGDRWVALILRALFTGINTFEKIREDSGIATNILSERLNWMTSLDLIRLDADAARGYRLTRKSVDYFPVLVMLMKWGDKYFAAPEGAPLSLFHGEDRHPMEAVVACSHCHQPIDIKDVTYQVDWPEGVPFASALTAHE
jgi:DNA-binding HxlR family transcriptional regulator